MPYGQMPALQHNGELICQSMNICRYLGRVLDLNGSDPWKLARAEMILDSFNEFHDSKLSLFHSFLLAS